MIRHGIPHIHNSIGKCIGSHLSLERHLKRLKRFRLFPPVDVRSNMVKNLLASIRSIWLSIL